MVLLLAVTLIGVLVGVVSLLLSLLSTEPICCCRHVFERRTMNTYVEGPTCVIPAKKMSAAGLFMETPLASDEGEHRREGRGG